MYVVNGGWLNPNSISVIDGKTNELIKTISVGFEPWGIAYNSWNNNIYVSNYGENTISVIDTKTNAVIKTIH